jgi:hypothetical protein
MRRAIVHIGRNDFANQLLAYTRTLIFSTLVTILSALKHPEC